MIDNNYIRNITRIQIREFVFHPNELFYLDQFQIRNDYIIFLSFIIRPLTIFTFEKC